MDKIFEGKLWDLKRDISFRTLLVYSDGDISDTVKYCFLLKEVRNSAKKIIFVTQNEIIKFLRDNNFNFEIYPMEVELNSLRFDYMVNLSDLARLGDFSHSQESYLEVNSQDVRLFRARYIREKRKFNAGVLFKNIDYDVFKIFAKIKDLNMFVFKGYNNFPEYNMFNAENIIKDIKDLAVAIKSMHMVVSDDKLVINLAGALGKSVFGIYNYNEEPNKYCKSIKGFVVPKKDGWKNICPVVKDKIEDYRIELREKYLLSCLDQVKKDKMRSEQDSIDVASTVLTNLFSEIHKQEYFDMFIDSQKKLLQMKPFDERYLGNLATYYRFHSKLIDEARCIWDKLIKIFEANPEDYPEFLFNYSCAKCNDADFDEFFKFYDYRFKKKHGGVPYEDFEKPRWIGQKDVSDKTLLVLSEQGFGDTFFASRHLLYVKSLFKKVIFVCRDKVEKVIKDSFPDIEVLPETEYKKQKDNIEYDYHTPLMSIMCVLKLYPEKFENTKWLVADKHKVQEFKKYFSDKKFNIGIFWESTKTNLVRYTTLKTMMPLAYLDNVQLYSLEIEKEDFEVNYIDEDVNIINIGKHFKDFSDTAAAIENCDLVVSTDASVMNLAGALGKKTFGLFNEYPEWRWYKLDGEDTGWYKMVKPFQAEIQDEFEPVLQRICDEVKILVNQKLNSSEDI